VPILAAHLLAASAARHGLRAPALQEDALALLAAQPWPGNVRELANVLERACILSESDRLDAAVLRPLLSIAGPDGEESRVRQALLETAGDKVEAARLLGVSYRTLQRRIKELDLEGFPRYRDGA